MTDNEAAETVRIVRDLSPGTVVTYGDISLEVYGHTGAGPAVGQVIRAETDNAERDGRPESFPWWWVVGKGLRPHEDAGGWPAKEGVTFRPGGTVHPEHHAPERVGVVPVPGGRPTIEETPGRRPEARHSPNYPRKRKEGAMALPITVSELRTDGSERNVGKNTIVIAMTRSDAGFPRDVLRHYAKTN